MILVLILAHCPCFLLHFFYLLESLSSMYECIDYRSVRDCIISRLDAVAVFLGSFELYLVLVFGKPVEVGGKLACRLANGLRMTVR